MQDHWLPGFNFNVEEWTEGDRFFGDFFVLATQVPSMHWHDVITDVLNLVDLALTANLVLIVIFPCYENFIRKIDIEARPEWPEGLLQVDFSELKQRLLGSVVVIAAVDALAWYFNLEKEVDKALSGYWGFRSCSHSSC